MTASTRGKLMLHLIIGLITLPAEALLLPVARTPNASVAARRMDRVARSDRDPQRGGPHRDVSRACIASAIMATLSPVDRSEAWRNYFRWLHRVASVTDRRPAGGDSGSDRHRVTRGVHRAGAPAVKDAHRQGFHEDGNGRSAKRRRPNCSSRLARRSWQAANALPLTQRIADRVRSWRVVSAAADDRPDLLQLQHRHRHVRRDAGSVAEVLGAVHVRVRSRRGRCAVRSGAGPARAGARSSASRVTRQRSGN